MGRAQCWWRAGISTPTLPYQLMAASLHGCAGITPPCEPLHSRQISGSPHLLSSLYPCLTLTTGVGCKQAERPLTIHAPLYRPWEDTELWVADLDTSGTVTSPRKVHDLKIWACWHPGTCPLRDLAPVNAAFMNLSVFLSRLLEVRTSRSCSQPGPRMAGSSSSAIAPTGGTCTSKRLLALSRPSSQRMLNLRGLPGCLACGTMLCSLMAGTADSLRDADQIRNSPSTM